MANLPLCTHRYALFVSYLGTRYNGSQRLLGRGKLGIQDTIQEALEWSMESFLPKKNCRVTACSRTDKGVHALMNCYSLPLMDFGLSTTKLRQMANMNLMRKNHDILVNDVLLVPADFHPRAHALSREYIYRIAVFDEHMRSSSLMQSNDSNDLMNFLPVTELYKVLPVRSFNYEKAIEAINVLKGEHDFAFFSFKTREEEDTVRHLEINLYPANPLSVDLDKSYPFMIYNFHFKSRAFLHNQVRRLVGAILSYASYQTSELSHLQFMIDNPRSKNWRGSMVVAEPWGLFLSKINYDISTLGNFTQGEKNINATNKLSDDDTGQENDR